jgi:hypothetical protein
VSAVSDETERVTVGGERDREKEQEETTEKSNPFESEESESATVGDESNKNKKSFGSDKAKEQQLEMKATKIRERATVGGESDKEKAKEQQSEVKLTKRRMQLKAIKRMNNV